MSDYEASVTASIEKALTPATELDDLRIRAIYEFREGWWIGHSPEFPAASAQERTLERAKRSMREVIELILMPDEKP